MSQPAPQPVVGDDGELLEIDSNVDPDAYTAYAERPAKCTGWP